MPRTAVQGTSLHRPTCSQLNGSRLLITVVFSLASSFPCGTASNAPLKSGEIKSTTFSLSRISLIKEGYQVRLACSIFGKPVRYFIIFSIYL